MSDSKPVPTSPDRTPPEPPPGGALDVRGAPIPHFIYRGEDPADLRRELRAQRGLEALVAHILRRDASTIQEALLSRQDMGRLWRALYQISDVRDSCGQKIGEHHE